MLIAAHVQLNPFRLRFFCFLSERKKFAMKERSKKKTHKQYGLYVCTISSNGHTILQKQTNEREKKEQQQTNKLMKIIDHQIKLQLCYR